MIYFLIWWLSGMASAAISCCMVDDRKKMKFNQIPSSSVLMAFMALGLGGFFWTVLLMVGMFARGRGYSGE